MDASMLRVAALGVLVAAALTIATAPAAANEPPTASFTISPSAPEVGDEVTLEADANDPDGSIESYQWWVDGEQVGTGDRTTVTLDQGGDVTIRLSVTDDDGATAYAEQTVEVSGDTGGMNVTIDVEPSRPTVGTPVTFRAEATPTASSYVWTFPDGSTTSSSVTSHTFDEAGTHTVEVVATDDDARATATVDVRVRRDTGIPTARIRYAPSDPLAGEEVRFVGDAEDDGSITSYRWTVDGEEATSSRRFSRAFEAGGDHVVRLTVTDDDGNRANASVTVAVEGQNVPPTATFGYEPLAPRAGENVTFTANAQDGDGRVTGYEWRVAGRPLGSGATVTHSFEAAGNITVALTVTDDDGATTETETTISVGEPLERDGSDESGEDESGDGDGGGEGLPGMTALIAVVGLAVAANVRRR